MKARLKSARIAALPVVPTIAASCLLAAVTTLVAAPVFAEGSVTILHTNDFHSRVEPISKYDSPCSAEDNTAGECFGGYARLVTAITEARTRNPDALLFDGGDQFQGSLFYTYYKGKVAAEIMNELEYDGMTVGNYEFDDGPEVSSSKEENDFSVVKMLLESFIF